MSRGTNARDHQVYRKRESDPQLGAKRYIEINRELRLFFDEVEAVTIDALQKINAMSTDKLRDVVSLYDELDEDSSRRPTLKVSERRLVSDFGRRQRIGWSMNDLGSTQMLILNALAKLDQPPGWHSDGSVDVTFNKLLRLGSGETAKSGKRKFAMVPDQTTFESEFLVREHETVFEGLLEGLKGKSNSKKALTFPYGDYVPQVTLGIFDERMSGVSRNAVMEAIGTQVLPFTCRLEPLILYTNQELSLGPHYDYDY